MTLETGITRVAAAGSFTGRLSDVTLETGITRVAASLVISDGTLCVRFAPKCLCIIIR